MKKFLVVIMLHLILTSTLHAQEADVNWGSLLKKGKGGSVIDILGSDQNGYYVLRNYLVASALITYADKLYLDRYSNNHELEFSHEIKLKDEEKRKLDFEGIYLVSGKLILFTSYYDKKADKNTIYAEHLSSTGEPEGDRAEVDHIVSDKSFNSGSFQIVLSKDQSKILVIHQEMYKKNSLERFFYKMFDKDLKVLWEKEIELPFKDSKFARVHGYEIDVDGRVYAQCGVTNDKKEKEKGKANYTYYIIEYNPAVDKLEKYNVNLAGKFISEITFADDPKRKSIVCAGFYSNKSGSNVAGVFYLRIDKNTGEVTEKGIKEFGKEFITQFLGARKANKGRELFAFDLDHFILREDGGAILVAEQYFMEEVCRTTTSNGVSRTQCEYHYYYNDIICASINPDASIAWVSRIPKLQHTVNDGGFYSSYVFGMKGGKFYFLFNDNPKNIRTSVPSKGKGISVKAMNRPKKSITMLYMIDASNGEVDAKPMFTAKADKTTILRPKLYMQVNEKDIVIYGERGKNYKFGTLTFD